MFRGEIVPMVPGPEQGQGRYNLQIFTLYINYILSDDTDSYYWNDYPVLYIHCYTLYLQLHDVTSSCQFTI